MTAARPNPHVSGAPYSTAHVTIDGASIVAPDDFNFQLRHYVVAPEVREGDKLVEIVRLRSGRLVKVDVTSGGTVSAPSVRLAIISRDQDLPTKEIDEARQRVSGHLGWGEDLRPFYALVDGDPVLSASVAHNFGAKPKSAYSMFEALVDVICAQNTNFRRLYTMRANLSSAFGEPFVAGGRTYHASPTPEQLAAAPIEAIRACGVGYRDRYIKGLAEASAGGLNLEAFKEIPREAARLELMSLPGIGPYTADLGLIIGAGRRGYLFLDVYIREALRQFYFGGDSVSDQKLLTFAHDRWGPYQGLAGFYLTTNTEVWARTLGIPFRLKSGALSDADA